MAAFLTTASVTANRPNHRPAVAKVMDRWKKTDTEAAFISLSVCLSPFSMRHDFSPIFLHLPFYFCDLRLQWCIWGKSHLAEMWYNLRNLDWITGKMHKNGGLCSVICYSNSKTQSKTKQKKRNAKQTRKTKQSKRLNKKLEKHKCKAKAKQAKQKTLNTNAKQNN